MISKIVVVVMLASLSVVAQGHSFHGASLSSAHNPNVVPLLLHKEARLIEAPTLSTLILKGAKSVGFILKSAWSVIGFKLGAIALIANLLIWGFKHITSIVLGGVSIFGFCKITGKCNLENIPKPVLRIGDTLMYAAQLQNGAEYDNRILF